ncbi:MAG: hypothetical protein ACJ75R_04715 [Solirubrobacterales bacterium]
MSRVLAVFAFLFTFAAAVAGAVAVSGAEPANQAGAKGGTPAKPLHWEANDLFIETNATDGDAGLQMNLDAEHWKRFELRDPKGRLLADVNARNRLRGVGLSELFFEAAEPPFTKFPFSRFKRRFPEGKYTFTGETTSGRELVGSDTLSHVVPDGPKVTFPTEGAEVDPSGLRVTWEPVTRPTGVKIVSYQVIVNQGDREMSAYLPPSATSLTIPAEFLVSGTKGGGEILAREQSGNQTITEIPSFTTR